jgi:hypothetical protein
LPNNHKDRGAARKRCRVGKHVTKKLVPEETVPLLRLQPSSGLLHVVPPPHGRLDIRGSGGRQPSALPCRCCLAVRRHLQRPASASNPPVLSSPPNNSLDRGNVPCYQQAPTATPQQRALTWQLYNRRSLPCSLCNYPISAPGKPKTPRMRIHGPPRC